MQQHIGITVGADLDQPILAAMHAKPIAIMLRGVVVEPPEIGRRIGVVIRKALLLLAALWASPAFADVPIKGPLNVPFFTVPTGGSIQNQLNRVAAQGGGTVAVQEGTFQIASALLMSSHTRLVCEAGAILQATFSPTGSGIGSLDKRSLILNKNFAASGLTDTDMEVDGCTFVNNRNNSVVFRKASNVRVINNRQSGGGSISVFRGVSDGVVQFNHAESIPGTCIDNFEAPTHIRILYNYCAIVSGSQQDGILMTGTDEAGTLAGMADDGEIVGNTILGNLTGGAGIWLNGLGVAGSGTSNFKVHDNYVEGATATSCYKVGGAGKGNILSNNTCHAPVLSAFVDANDDPGGTPTGTTFQNNYVIASNLTTQAPYTTNATGTMFIDNHADGTFPNPIIYDLGVSTNPVVRGPIATITALSSATLDLGLIQAGYREIELHCTGFLPATVNDTLNLLVGTGATPTFFTTNYSYTFQTSIANTSGVLTAASTSASTIQMTAPLYDGVASGNDFTLNFVDIVGTTPRAYWRGNFSQSNVVRQASGAGLHDTQLQITASRLMMSTGNIATGRCVAYSK